MMDLIRWAWAFMALFFLIGELFTPGFILICFGIGAGAAAILAFLDVSLLWQFVAFAGVSGISILLSRPFARRVSNPAENVFGVDRVLGKEAIVLIAIDPETAHGRVRVDREEWLADSEDGSSIPDRTRVQVVGIEGTRLKVRRLPGTS